MGLPFFLIRDTPSDSYQNRGARRPSQKNKTRPPHHGIADASRFDGRLAAAATPAAPRAAARDVRPRHGLRRRAGPLRARERAADAQPVRDRVGATGHQLHRHEARLRRGLGRRHRQDCESFPLAPYRCLPFLTCVVSPQSWHPVSLSLSLSMRRRYGALGYDLRSLVDNLVPNHFISIT
jgi:hypothetical protein